MNKQGFAPVAIIIIVVVLLAAGGGVYYWQKLQPRVYEPPANNEPNQVACPADAKQCPDGSYVSRIAPNCEFAQCPGPNQQTSVPADWKTYRNEEYGFEFRYPADLSWSLNPDSHIIDTKPHLDVSVSYLSDEYLSFYSPPINFKTNDGLSFSKSYDDNTPTCIEFRYELVKKETKQVYFFYAYCPDGESVGTKSIEKTIDQVVQTFKFIPTP